MSNPLLVSTHTFPIDTHGGHFALADDDINSDGVDELGVLCRNRNNNYPYVLIRDAEDGSNINNIACDRNFLAVVRFCSLCTQRTSPNSVGATGHYHCRRPLCCVDMLE